MSEINKAVKGTADILPDESYKWQYAERKLIETAGLFGFEEIRVPVFEHTEVFSRSVGDTTDVVQKEMYTFDDKGGRSLTLRPELTAGVIRSCVEKGLVSGTLPVKVCYTGTCYRYEKPQAGRLREFHQFGVECVGASLPDADAELILLARKLLCDLGVKNISLELNSIGCPECREKYRRALIDYFNERRDQLCGTCLERLEKNPMRILDCKSPVCKEAAKDAPVMLDYLCEECRAHFETVKDRLAAAGAEFTVNPRIVRGLDYYTKTVFEFVSNDLGAQSTVLGGGRYDGLIAQMGGQPTPALGFAMGIERLMMIMQSQGTPFPERPRPDVYVAPICEAARKSAAEICAELRGEGFSALTDLSGRSAKAQLKFADKSGAKFTVVIGEDELSSGKAVLKNMADGGGTEVELPGGIVRAVYEQNIKNAMGELTDSVEKLGEIFKK